MSTISESLKENSRTLFLIVTSLVIMWLALTPSQFRSHEQKNFDEWVHTISKDDDSILTALSISLSLFDEKGKATEWSLSGGAHKEEKRRLLELMSQTGIFSLETSVPEEKAPHVVMKVAYADARFEQTLSQAQVDRSVEAQTVLKLMVLFSSGEGSNS